MIKILSCVKFHGGIRLEMVCGGRAYRYMTEVFDQNRLVSQTFSAKILETGEAARKVQEALAAEKLCSSNLRKRVFENIAVGFAGQENVVHFEAGLEPGQVRDLAERISKVCTGFCAVFSEKEEGYAYCLATADGDLRELGKTMTATLCGRGGGKPNFQQGSVKADKAQIEAFFKA